MAVLPDYVSGTITLANGSTNVTGSGTAFQLAAFKSGDTLQIQNLTAVIASVNSDTSLTLTEPWTGTSLVDAPYRARYLPDGARVTARTTTLIELIGNGVLENIASLPVEPGKLLIGNEAGEYELIDRHELGGGGGSSWDATTPNLAGLAGFESEPNGYKVLVEDNGTGRSAVYIKLSTGWSDPIYFTGPSGPLPEITIDDTITLAPGQPATVTASPTPDGFDLRFSIPAGKGFNPRGEYVAATTYQLGDVVTYNGSSYVAKVITQGVLPTNTTNWNLVALRGEDGTGTGDVSGPSSSVASRIAVFNGTTGKQIADSGVTVDQIRANTANVGAAVAGANGQSTINDADTATGVLSGTGTLVRWTWGNIKAWIKGWITKSDVGLGNVSNLAPADLPVSTAQAAADALRVLKAGDANLGKFTSNVIGHGDFAGKTIDVSAYPSNFQAGNLASGTVTFTAPTNVYDAATYCIWVYYTAGTLTASGFSRVDGALKVGQNWLYITVNGIATMNIVSAS